MAENCYLWIKANGVDIHGESTVTSEGRQDTIEGLKFEHRVHIPSSGTRLESGRRVHGPVVITKRFDKSSPLLYKALCNNEVVEATIKFYRANPSGDGTTEQFFTIKLEEARIVSIQSRLPDTLDPGASNLPCSEDVSFFYGKISWTYEPGGVEHIDHWSQAE
jgi:type VI secretion system secreted protein Hcp